MKKLETAGLLVALSLALAACADDVDVTAQDEPNDLTQFALCRTMQSSLRGRPATVYRASSDPDFLAVAIDGQIVCVDTPAETIQTGLIAVPPPVQPRDGTPLPAQRVNGGLALHLTYLPNFQMQ